MRYLSESVTSTAYKISRKLVKVKCDVCGTEIAADGSWNDSSKRYYEVTTGHRDWGNDSIDSVKTEDVCPTCLPNYIKKYFEESIRSSTAYCDIESAGAYPETETKVVDTIPDEATLVEEDHDIW